MEKLNWLANIRSSTSPGSPYGRLRRALDRRNLLAARSAARELGDIGIVEALELLLLTAEQQPAKLDRAAVRWQARYCQQMADVGPVRRRRSSVSC